MRNFKIVISQLKAHKFAAFQGIMTAMFRNDPILVFCLDTEILEDFDSCDVSGFVVRKGEISELDSLKMEMESVPWEFSCHEYDGVTDFFVGCDGSRIVSIVWICYKDDPNRLLKLGSRDAELKYGLTLPEYRGRGLLPRILRAQARFLRERGIRRMYACIHEQNRSSIRGTMKAGFKLAGKCRLLKLFGVQVSKRFVTSKD